MILHYSGAEVAIAHGYLVTTVILSQIMIPVFWICGAGCKETYAEQLHANAQEEKLGFIGSLKEIVKNDQLLMVVLATI